MVHVLFGLVFIIFGSWVLSHNWWAFLDLLRVIFPFLIVCLGIVMVLSGLKGKPRTN